MTASREDPAELWKALYMAFLELHERNMAAVAALGTTPGELKALLRLQPGGTVTAGELSRLWNNDPSTTTWLVDRLESRGLVARRVDPIDRRVKRVELTPTGLAVRAQIVDALYSPPPAFQSATSVHLEAAALLSDLLAPTEPDG